MTFCATCKEEVIDPVTVDGQQFCEDCAEDAEACANCESLGWPDDMYFVANRVGRFCDDCVHDLQLELDPDEYGPDDEDE